MTTRPVDPDSPPTAAPILPVVVGGSKKTWVIALAGALIAALLSWGAGEAVVDRFLPPSNVNPREPDPDREDPNNAVVKNSVLAYGLQGAILGLMLGLAGASRRGSARARAAVPAALTGLLLGGGLGAGASFGLFTIFFHHADLNSHDLTLPLLAHAGVWSLVGATGGLAFGLGRGEGKRAVALAAAGGFVGAILGAGLYEVVGAIVFPLDKTGTPLATSAAARFFAHAGVDILAAFGVVLALGTSRRSSRIP